MVGVLTIFLTLISIIFAYWRYTEYEEKVQRELYESLVGKTYPRFSVRYGGDKYNFQVINVNVNRSLVNDWETTIVLKFDMEEFPWKGSSLQDWDYDSGILMPAAKREDVSSIEEFMEQELLNLCRLNRKIGPKFEPKFSRSNKTSYGPILKLHFERKDLFFLTEQLEMVSESIPVLFATWLQSLAGLNTQTQLHLMAHKAISEEVEFDEEDYDQS